MAMAYDWSLISCPNRSTSAPGLTALICSLAMESIPRPARRVEHAADDAVAFEVALVLGQQQPHHQADDLARV